MPLKRASGHQNVGAKPVFVRFDRALKERLDRYCKSQRKTLADTVRGFVAECLARHDGEQVDGHPHGAVLYEKLDHLREETDRLERFMREVARTALGTEMVLAHWAAVAGGTRGANEDQILDEVRRAGEEELRSFLERECPGLLQAPQTGVKKPRVH